MHIFIYSVHFYYLYLANINFFSLSILPYVFLFPPDAYVVYSLKVCLLLREYLYSPSTLGLTALNVTHHKILAMTTETAVPFFFHKSQPHPTH